MNRPYIEQEIDHLNPGELFILREPRVVTTVLGSCVSVTFYNERLMVSAINHAVLPRSAKIRDGENGFKFADLSLLHIINTLTRMGIKPGETTVKVFGGSDLFNFKAGRNGSLKIGRNNIQSTLEILQSNRYVVNACDVGGGRGRRIYFNTSNGEVIVKRLKAGLNPNQPLLNDCNTYMAMINGSNLGSGQATTKGERKWIKR